MKLQDEDEAGGFGDEYVEDDEDCEEEVEDFKTSASKTMRGTRGKSGTSGTNDEGGGRMTRMKPEASRRVRQW